MHSEKKKLLRSSSRIFLNSPCPYSSSLAFLQSSHLTEAHVLFLCVMIASRGKICFRYKDMEPVSRSSFMHTSYRGDGTACLQLFSPVADRDSGTYRCVARNSEGSCHSEAILSIQSMYIYVKRLIRYIHC